MTHLVRATCEYTKTREQYGAPLAKFQVLQHRMADMYIQTETVPVDGLSGVPVAQ
jgi:alkylation response protein AidB-like acyl-CoA dehydrogenase